MKSEIIFIYPDNYYYFLKKHLFKTKINYKVLHNYIFYLTLIELNNSAKKHYSDEVLFKNR
ncbi:hypothetical protein CMU71_00050 [Elizabethkingia anophelis]|nr:hypothetical protein [Elizabethkingia anophelis]MDV3971796.1 hypothetical protein [Elizabethkingia anophelis]OPC29362.1 hypothetical protein BAX98_11000 [Elizabethkingia anophelis]OPC45410.1 hypothetical protein BAY02_00050 [Elizabethkingia anophelis]